MRRTNRDSVWFSFSLPPSRPSQLLTMNLQLRQVWVREHSSCGEQYMFLPHPIQYLHPCYLRRRQRYIFISGGGRRGGCLQPWRYRPSNPPNSSRPRSARHRCYRRDRSGTRRPTFFLGFPETSSSHSIPSSLVYTNPRSRLCSLGRCHYRPYRF